MQLNDTTNSSNDKAGIGISDVLIDSGCTICVVRRDALPDSIKIEPAGNHNMATLIDGSKMDILGCVNLTVSYLGKTVELPFYVVAESSWQLTLGTNWIRASGAVLQSDGTKLGVTFGGNENNIVGNTTGCCCASPRMSVNVEGILGLVTALVDTGASESSIKKDILTDDQNSMGTPAKNTSTIANGNQIMEKTKLVSLNITFQKITTCIENVKIASKLDDQLVLGMDWIHQTRAKIQYDGLKITVKQDSRLNKEDE